MERFLAWVVGDCADVGERVCVWFDFAGGDGVTHFGESGLDRLGDSGVEVGGVALAVNSGGFNGIFEGHFVVDVVHQGVEDAS